MQSNIIVIPARYCGPPNSANGGYVAGRLAAHIGSSAEVTLKHPPPLDKKLDVMRLADEKIALLNDGVVIAEACPAETTTGLVARPDYAAATAAAGRTFAAADHPIPGCFVCGPGRAIGDGLRIHVGPVDPEDSGWQGALAAPWVPQAEHAGQHGEILPEFVWAALDCPTAYACSSARGMPPILLGRQTVSIKRLPEIDERCVIVSERRRRDGRKHFADAVLLGADGETLAVCNAIWIEVTLEKINANA